MDNSGHASSNKVFGSELLLDLYDCKEGACDDLALNYQFLDEIVGFLGMEKQSPPSIFRSDETRFPDKAGHPSSAHISAPYKATYMPPWGSC